MRALPCFSRSAALQREDVERFGCLGPDLAGEFDLASAARNPTPQRTSAALSTMVLQMPSPPNIVVTWPWLAADCVLNRCGINPAKLRCQFGIVPKAENGRPPAIRTPPAHASQPF